VVKGKKEEEKDPKVRTKTLKGQEQGTLQNGMWHRP
jgi:uncharacterized cupin superfamily protein